MSNPSGTYILLAAGFSRRFGSPKLLHLLPSGKSIVNSTIDALHKSGCTFCVVAREDDLPLLAHLNRLKVNIIKVSNAEKGLSSVIAEASEVLDSRDADWIGICLADMPYIKPQTFNVLSSHTSPDTIVRPLYQGKPGHPVLFGRKFVDSLRELTGDDGAKSVIKQFRDSLCLITVDDSMVLHDIDKPENIL